MAPTSWPASAGTFGIADCHNDMLMSMLARREAGDEGAHGDFWMEQLRAGHVTLQVLPVYTEDAFVQEAALRRSLLMIDEAHRFADRHADEVAIVTTGAEIAEARAAGLIALVLAIEGAEPVGRDLAILRTLHRSGIRMISLTWNRRTMLADGVAEEDTGGRLTNLGRAVVREMEETGIVLDVSHISQNGFWDVVSLAQKPFIASHSSAMAVHEHPRNLTDDQLRALAQSESMVCANAYGRFVGDAPTIETFVDHIEHLLAVVGDTRVGLGLDFILDVWKITDGANLHADDENLGEPFVKDFVRPADLPLLADALARRFGPERAALVAESNLTAFLSNAL
jgi:membrane dipeptidase